MGEIKSAWEIALERTKSVEGDKEAVEANKFKKEGSLLVSKFLDNQDVNLKDTIKGYDKKRLIWAREGMLKALLANLILPQDQTGSKKLRRLSEAFPFVIENPKLLSSMFSQLESFFEEYLTEKESLRERLVQQFTPRLRQKEEELSKKMGMDVHVDVNNDPEFANNLRRLMVQLDETRDRLEEDRTRGFLRAAAWAATQETGNSTDRFSDLMEVEPPDAGISRNPSI